MRLLDLSSLPSKKQVCRNSKFQNFIIKSRIFLYVCIFYKICSIFFHFSDKMAEIMKKEADVKKSEITLTVEDICFVKIPEDNIKLENTGIQGKLNNFTF